MRHYYFRRREKNSIRALVLDTAIILLLDTWIFEEPFVAKFPAMGLKRRGALQTRGHL